MIPPGTILEGEPTLEFRSISRGNIPSVTFLSMIALAIMASGCDESLPPRDTPTNVVRTAVSMASGEYSFLLAEPHDVIVSYDEARISATLENIYTEVLQDSVSIHGSIDIWDIDHPNNRASLDLKKTYVSPAPTNPGDLLTLLPGAHASLGMAWNHMTTDALPRPFCSGVHITIEQVTDPKTNITTTYGISDTVHLALQAHIQIFATYGNVTTPVSYANFVYLLIYPRQN